MKRLVFLASMAMLLSGCLGPRTLPVHGQFQSSTETFEGSATGTIDGTGTIHVKTSTGVSCSGGLVSSAPRTGDGVLNCDDGRTGSFHFTSAAGHGTGYGDLNGQRLTFTLGEFK